MNWINDLFNYISRIFQWWIIVMPWEQGLRIRLGKYENLLEKGVYLKLPIIDQVYIQTTRLRIKSMPLQTLTTRDGVTISLLGSIGYSIVDIRKLYYTLYQPDGTLMNMVMSCISEYVATHDIKDCSPERIEKNIIIPSPEQYGISDLSVKILGYAIVKTYRLIQDGHYFDEGMRL